MIEQTRHAELAFAFDAIDDKMALAWSVVTGKSELVVTQAIAARLNRSAGRLVAIPEFKRMDLALLGDSDGRPEDRLVAVYQAQAAFLGDYQQHRIDRHDPWLGGLLNADFPKLQAFASKRRVNCVACLFYLYELSDGSRHVKYPSTDHVSVDEALAFVRGHVHGQEVFSAYIDCGKVHGTGVKIHLLAFEPDPIAPGSEHRP